MPARSLGYNRVIGHTKLISCSRTNQSQILTEWQAKNIINLAHPSLVLRQAINQGGVTPIDSIVTAATVGQSFDRLFLAV